MTDPCRTVFLSYRRDVSWSLAHAVRNDLDQHGFDVFMDVDDIGSGEFERVLLREIEARPHFLVLLEPRSLDRIAESGDWLRREIIHAMVHGRNVVPMTASGYRMPRETDLPADVAGLTRYNAVSVPHDYFAEAMSKVRHRFLGSAEPSAVAAVGPAARGAAPDIRVAMGSDGGLVQWSHLAGATGYELERSERQDFAMSGICYQGSACAYPTSRSGWFRVRATGAAGPGRWSRVVEMSSPPSRERSPGGQQLLQAPNQGPRILTRYLVEGALLTWTVMPGAVEYIVEASPTADFTVGEVAFRGAQRKHIHLAAPGTTVYFRVRGVDAKGQPGEWSKAVSAGPVAGSGGPVAGPSGDR